MGRQRPGRRCPSEASLGSARPCAGSDSREPGEAQSLLAPGSQRHRVPQVCAHLIRGLSGQRGRGWRWRSGKRGHPCPGGASALFLGLHAGSASASHTFRQCTWPDGEVACAVHSPPPPVASRGDVSICKVQVSASSFLGAECATGARVGARRLRPGAWEGRLCRKGRWSSQPSRLGLEPWWAAGQWAAVLSEGRAWRRERVCVCARSVRMGRRGPEPLLPVAGGGLLCFTGYASRQR